MIHIVEGTTDSQDSEETQTPDTPPETTPQEPITDPEIPTTPDPETTPDTTVVPDPEVTPVTPEEVVVPEEMATAPADEADAEDGIMLLDDVMPLADPLTITTAVKVGDTATPTAATIKLTGEYASSTNVIDGKPITFTVAPADGYRLKGDPVVEIVGDANAQDKLETKADGFSIANGTDTDAIAGNVTITANVEPIKAHYVIKKGTSDVTDTLEGVTVTASDGAQAPAKKDPAEIDPSKGIAFTVTCSEASEVKLASVTCAVGSGNAEEITPEDDKYTVDLTGVHEDIVVTLNVAEDLTYTVAAPTKNDHDITWKIAKKPAEGGDPTYGTADVALKAGDTLAVQATLKTDSAYNITAVKINNVAATEGDNVWTGEIDAADLTALADQNRRITIDDLLLVTGEKVQVTVNIVAGDMESGATSAGHYTVKWGYKPATGTTTYDKTVANGEGKIGPDKNATVALKIEAKNGYVISDVTADGVTLTSKNVDDDGATIAEFKAEVGDADKTITVVTKKVGNVLNVRQGTADAQIAKVQYKIGSGTPTAATKTANGWEVRSDGDSVKLVVTPKLHNEIICVHEEGTEPSHAIDPETGVCAGNKATVEGGIATLTEAVNMSEGSVNKTYTIYTEPITVPYKFTTTNFDDDDNVSFTVEGKDGSAVAPVSKGTGAEAYDEYTLLDGETYKVKINGVDLAALASVQVDSEDVPYDANAGAFLLTTDVEKYTQPNAVEIVVTKTAKAGADIAFVMDAEMTGNKAASVTVAEYQKLNDTTNKVEKGTVAKTELSTSPTNAEKALTGSAFTFALAPKDNTDYKISTVTAIKTGPSTEVKPVDNGDGTYTIAEVPTEGVTVTVATALDPEKAHNIIVEVDENAKVEGGITVAGSEAAEDGKTFYLEKKSDAIVSVTIGGFAAEDGYAIDTEKVTKNGETAVTGMTVSGTQITDTITAGDSRHVDTYKIVTKEANPIQESDKFVTLQPGDNVEIKVTEPADLKPVSVNAGKYTYQLTKDVMAEDGETVKVPGIHELRFDILVPYGMKFEDASLIGNAAIRKTAETRVKSSDGESWVYSYKVVGSSLETTTKEAAEADPIDTGNAASETIKVKKKTAESGNYEIKVTPTDTDYAQVTDETAKTIAYGNTVYIKINPGETLEVNDKPVDVDDSHIYRFVAELDETVAVDQTTYNINVKNAGDYYLLYTFGDKDSDAPIADTEYDEGKVGDAAITTGYEQTVHVWLTGDDGIANISKVECEPAEGAKSTAKIVKSGENNTNKATVVMKDASYTVKFYTEKDVTVGSITGKQEVLAATLKLVSNSAEGAVLTANGIKNNGTLTLDAMSEAEYPLTLKEGKNVVNIADYNLSIVSDKKGSEKVANVNFNGKSDALVIKTLKSEGEEEFKITAPGVEKPLLTFKVAGKAPVLKMKSLNSSNQGMNSIMIDTAADGSIGKVNDAFHLYYKVQVALSPKNTGASKSNILGTYYLPATDENSAVKAVSQLFKVHSDEADKLSANTYTFTVGLAAIEGAELTDSQMGNPKEGTLSAGTVTAKFETAQKDCISKDFTNKALNYYEDKLGVTKKTTSLFSGERNVVVAVPKFSKNAGHIDNVTATVLYKDGREVPNQVANDDEYVEATVNDKMEVVVKAGKYAAGSYDVIISATADIGDRRTDGFGGEYEMYRATAKVAITVKKGINRIDVDVPSQVAVVDSKKDTTFTLKPVGIYDPDDNGKVVKAQSQKFLYDIEYPAGSKLQGMVSYKGNKFTISKNAKASNDPALNKFTIIVRANDFSGNNNVTVYSQDVTVTNQALQIGKVQLENGGKVYTGSIDTLALDNATLKITDSYGNAIDADAVKVTPVKGKIYAKKVGSEWKVKYDGFSKSVSFKVSPLDGGKGKAVTAKYTVTYPAVEKYDMALKNTSGVYMANRAMLSSGALLDWVRNDCSYVGKGNDLIEFMVNATSNGVKDAPKKTFNYDVKIKNGKNLSGKTNEANGIYSIMPSKDTVTITITDKETKKPYTFTFKNTNWKDTKAPSVSTKNKLYYVKYPTTADGHTAGDAIPQDMRYTLKKAEGYTAVKLTYLDPDEACTSFSANEGIKVVTKTVPIVNGAFTLEGMVAESVGTDKFSVVYGKATDDGSGDVTPGSFEPLTRETTLSIKVNKVGTPKAVTKYNINPNELWGVKLSAKPVLKNTDQGKAMVVYQQVLAGNYKGQMNRFTDFFETDGTLLKIKDDVKNNAAKMTELTNLAASKEGKNHLFGYLVYSYDIGNGTVTKTEKITVTLKDSSKGSKYTADSVSILGAPNAEATTTIRLDGDAIALAQVATDTKGWKASFGQESNKAAGRVVLKAEGTPVSGKVDLYIIRQNSKNANVTDEAAIRENGFKVSVQVNVQAMDANASKLIVTKTAKTPEAAHDKANKRVKLTATFAVDSDIKYALSNTTISAVAKADDADLTKAADKAANAAVIRAAFSSGTLTIELDREKIDAKKTKVLNVPVKVSFTNNAAAEIVTFPVKITEALSMAAVKSQIESKLAGFVVTSFDPSGAAAVTAVNAELAKVKEGMNLNLAGVEVADGVKASDYNDSHKIEFTLTDITQTGEAATTKAVITLTEGTPKPGTADEAISQAFAAYAIPGQDGTVASGKKPVTKNLTEEDIKIDLKAALDQFAAGRYIVNVSSVECVMNDNAFDTEGNPIERVSTMTVKYTVTEVTTGTTGSEKTAVISSGAPSIS